MPWPYHRSEYVSLENGGDAPNVIAHSKALNLMVVTAGILIVTTASVILFCCASLLHDIIWGDDWGY